MTIFFVDSWLELHVTGIKDLYFKIHLGAEEMAQWLRTLDALG